VLQGQNDAVEVVKVVEVVEVVEVEEVEVLMIEAGTEFGLSV
jgi:hypothetical protein